MSLNLQLAFRNYTKTPVSEPALQRLIREFLSYRKVEDDIFVELLVVGKQRMQKLNKKYRNVAEPTDVLSFPLLPILSSQGFSVVESISNKYSTSPDVSSESWNDKTTNYLLRTTNMLGSIVICPEIVNHHWRTDIYGDIDQKSAILYVVVHALLHLLGYDHETEQDDTRWQKIVAEFWARSTWHKHTPLN